MSQSENLDSPLSNADLARAVTSTPPETTPPAAAAPAKVPPPKPPRKAPPTSNDPISRFRNKTEDEEARMGFIDHLLELRKRLWVSIIAVVICVVISLVFYEDVYQFLLAPIRVVDAKYVGILTALGKPPPDGQVVHITTTEPLGTMLSVIWLGFWAGLVVASPIVMYELWAFVAPGLHAKEKNAIKPVLYGGAFFFLAGAALAYYVLAPLTFDFFLWLDLRLKVTPNWTSEKCIELLITMMIVSGLLWELPLLVAGMARLGVVSAAWLLKYWRALTFGSIVMGMIVSPGNDLISMGAFSGMILAIYLVSILMAFIFYRAPVDPYAPKPATAKTPPDGIAKS
jgi:sec-independent protein translocase protein TatC